MPRAASPLPIAIIGAGMAGLSAADRLVSAGKKVILFDKGRGPGGRMSTRRMTDADGLERYFDHGAQYFTARAPQFIAQTKAWAAQNIVAQWPEASKTASGAIWTGVPGMNAPIKAMASAHNVHWATRINALEQCDGAWHLLSEDEQEFGPFGAIIIAIPAEQVAQLVAPHQPDFAAQATAIKSLPCWTVMLGFSVPLPTDSVSLRDHGPIGWAARNTAKPGRASAENWVIQAGADWSTTHLEADKDDIIAPLSAALAQALALDTLPKPIIAAAHRWRYAMVPKSTHADSPFLWDNDLQMGMCGDWLSGPRIENAWLSGHDLAQHIA